MINIELINFLDAFNEFDSDDISDNLDYYILEKSKILRSKKITIKISGNYTEDEKKRLENAIHSHYRQKNNYLNKIDRYDDVYRLFFILMGTLLIFISYNCKTFASELFLIAGWVAISEIVYDLLFKTINRKRENVALKKLLKCKIIFED